MKHQSNSYWLLISGRWYLTNLLIDSRPTVGLHQKVWRVCFWGKFAFMWRFCSGASLYTWGDFVNVASRPSFIKTHKKIKLGYTRNMYIFCFNCQSVVNLKLKFWAYIEKNKGFHLTPKKVLLPVEPWGMQFGAFYLKVNFGSISPIFGHISKCSMMPTWHQPVSLSGYTRESETAKKSQLYAIATSISNANSFVCQLDYHLKP